MISFRFVATKLSNRLGLTTWRLSEKGFEVDLILIQTKLLHLSKEMRSQISHLHMESGKVRNKINSSKTTSCRWGCWILFILDSIFFFFGGGGGGGGGLDGEHLYVPISMNKGNRIRNDQWDMFTLSLEPVCPYPFNSLVNKKFTRKFASLSQLRVQKPRFLLVSLVVTRVGQRCTQMLLLILLWSFC